MRSNWKPKNKENLIKFIDIDINKKLEEKEEYYLKRSFIIDYFFLNKKIFVYNGKNYKSFIASKEHLYHKSGEFVITRNLMDKQKQEKKIKKKMLK
jgi:ribosomal protein S19